MACIDYVFIGAIEKQKVTKLRELYLDVEAVEYNLKKN